MTSHQITYTTCSCSHRVITYQHAYVGGTSTLCARCAADPAVIDRIPALGPVSHGEHEGRCNSDDTMTDHLAIVIVRYGVVIGRGATLLGALTDALGRVDVTPDRASELRAGDSRTHMRYSADIIAAAITAIHQDGHAKSEACIARRTREIAAERAQRQREDRGIYGE